MDFLPVWCPICDKQISSKRRTEIIPPPPHFKNKGSLIEGTGARKHAHIPPGIRTTPRIRIIIDQGPLPYYCSDQCRLRDLNPGILPHDYDPIRVQQTAPVLTSKPNQANNSPKYNSPAFLHPYSPDSDHSEPFDANSPHTPGVMTANTYPHSLASKAKLERNGISNGWNDGSNAWRTAAYSLSSNDHLSLRPAHTLSTSALASRPIRSAPHQYDAATLSLMAQFSASLSRRFESRLSSCNSPPHPHQVKERPPTPGALVGKILVPDVKLKVGVGSAESLPTHHASKVSHFDRPHSPAIWSPSFLDSTSTLSGSDNTTLLDIEDEDLPLDHASQDQPRRRESETQVLRRGLTGLSIGDDFNKAFVPPKRPTGQTRAWSYDNVHTYEAMQMPNPNARLWNFHERAV